MPRREGSALTATRSAQASRVQCPSEIQIDNVANYQRLRNQSFVGATQVATDNAGLAYFQKTARDHQNVFTALMEAVKTHSLAQISHALHDVGGEDRWNM